MMLVELRRMLRKVFRNRLTAASAAGIILLLLLAVSGPAFVPHPEHAVGVSRLDLRLLSPSSEALFGTDDMGRDVFSRVVIGARLSMMTSLLVVFLAASFGTLAGLAAGYFRGWVDEAIMRLTDAFLSIPSLVLALAVGASLGPGLTNALLAISLVWWPWYARIARSQVLMVKQSEFVEAARAAGASHVRIVFFHILPACIPPILVQASLDMGYVVLTAASLGFLGLGAQPPTAEWGLMVSAGRNLFPRWWWVATFPGLAIMLTVLVFNLAGDGLRDLLDPRFRR